MAIMLACDTHLGTRHFTNERSLDMRTANVYNVSIFIPSYTGQLCLTTLWYRPESEPGFAY